MEDDDLEDDLHRPTKAELDNLIRLSDERIVFGLHSVAADTLGDLLIDDTSLLRRLVAAARGSVTDLDATARAAFDEAAGKVREAADTKGME